MGLKKRRFLGHRSVPTMVVLFENPTIASSFGRASVGLSVGEIYSGSFISKLEAGELSAGLCGLAASGES